MTFGREKRQMLAWMALLAPLPLPFNDTLEWPALFVYALFLVYFLQRLEKNRITVLPNWTLNVLGLAYLPVLFVDLKASLLRSSPVTALIHLIMFLILVKLYSMRREKDKWHLAIACFFVFLGGMATSTHLASSLYLLAFMMFSLLVLGRFAFLHTLSGLEGSKTESAAGTPWSSERRLPGGRAVPFRGPLLVGTALVVAIAIPTFATIPRFREPFILGPGGGTGGLVRTTGFSDSVDLSLTTSIRSNRDVVLRLKYSGDEVPADSEIRLKGATYDHYEDHRWHRVLQLSRTLSPERDEAKGYFYQLSSEESSATTVEIFRERMNSRSLPLPMETVGLTTHLPILFMDLGGALFLPGVSGQTLRYRADVASGPRIVAQFVRADSWEESPLSALDASGITEAMRELALEVAGEGTPNEQIDRIERHLLSEYTYTLDFVGREGESPIEDFLFTYKSGHCELFATSMVLFLRAAGIPARLSTGFLGAEYNPLEGYYMVRQENAHAWVEAFTPERGWRVYDPTPPEGRPTAPERSLSQLVSQLYDYLTFRWDRWVLTYGADDQRTFFQQLRERFAELWGKLTRWGDDSEEDPAARPAGGIEASRDDVIREPDLWLNQVPLALSVLLFLGGVAGIVVWHRRKPLTGESAYRQLRSWLVRAGVTVTASSAPLELRELAVARFPSAARPARRLVELYLRESFAEEPLGASERVRLREYLRSVREAIAHDERERRRATRAPVPVEAPVPADSP